MNVEIFIVSCAKHFDWLDYCLRSIAKFAVGFQRVKVLVPNQDSNAANELCSRVRRKVDICAVACEEWPAKGMLWHMAEIMHADEWCPTADFILHTDSDCLFTEPVTPEDYFLNGKSILYYERFESIGKQHPDVLRWQQVTQDCVRFPVQFETMRRHPAVHPRKLYRIAREEIERKTGLSCNDYIRAQRNEFPQSFCEFNTLGNVAMQYISEEYALYNTELNEWPPQKLVQFWSHSPPHIPQKPVFKGEPFECTPDYFLK